MEAKRAGVPPLLGRSGQTPFGPWIWRILHHSTAGALMLVPTIIVPCRQRLGQVTHLTLEFASTANQVSMKVGTRLVKIEVRFGRAAEYDVEC